MFYTLSLFNFTKKNLQASLLMDGVLHAITLMKCIRLTLIHALKEIVLLVFKRHVAPVSIWVVHGQSLRQKLVHTGRNSVWDELLIWRLSSGAGKRLVERRERLWFIELARVVRGWRQIFAVNSAQLLFHRLNLVVSKKQVLLLVAVAQLLDICHFAEEFWIESRCLGHAVSTNHVLVQEHQVKLLQMNIIVKIFIRPLNQKSNLQLFHFFGFFQVWTIWT